MTDYPKALAALREARTKFDAEVARVAGPQTLQHRAEELSARVLDFLDALEAAHPVAWMTAGGDVSRSYAWAAERCMETDPSPLYLAPQAPPAALAVPPERDWTMIQSGDASIPAWVVHYANAIGAYMKAQNVQHWAVGPVQSRNEAKQPAALAVPAANVTPMRQPRADLARLVESIKDAVYANGDGLSVTEAIGALELAKLELLKEQEQ